MNASLPVVPAVLGAALLLLLDMALTVALSAAAALNRVALHRMSQESDASLEFLESLRSLPSRHRLSAFLARQLCLVGAVLLLALGARGLDMRFPVISAAVVVGVGGVLVLEAVVARSIALWSPRRALRATAFAVRLARALLWPVVEPTHAVLNRIAQRQGGRHDETSEEEQEHEVEALIEVGEREGLFEAAEGEMMRGIVDLDETIVREIMTPRTNIVALPSDSTVEEARRKLLEAGHSRLPVYRDTIDEVIGILHARDLFRAWEENGDARGVEAYLRPATFVPETLSAAELLAEMRQTAHMAVVLDEYGGTAGIVTLEDLLEEIVGEIRDEHEDDEGETITADGEDVWIVDAGVHVEELEDLFDVEFGERDFDTVGGLAVYGFGRVPQSGERTTVQGLDVEVLEADRRRVHRVRVCRTAEGEDADRATS